jgi:hypothetical protein
MAPGVLPHDKLLQKQGIIFLLQAGSGFRIGQNAKFSTDLTII